MKQKINWKQKLTSRKLWAALVGIDRKSVV